MISVIGILKQARRRLAVQPGWSWVDALNDALKLQGVSTLAADRATRLCLTHAMVLQPDATPEAQANVLEKAIADAADPTSWPSILRPELEPEFEL